MAPGRGRRAPRLSRRPRDAHPARGSRAIAGAHQDVIPLILAAGASSRMGAPKALLPLGATTALGRIVGACRAAGLGQARVVVGAHGDRIASAAEALGALAVPNPRWPEGRTTSIQAGVAALPEGCAGVLLWPVDVCLPGASTVALLLQARTAAPDAQAWVPCHAGRRGHPLLLTRAAAARFTALAPDEPARVVVRALAAEGALHHVEVADDAVLVDVNTPEEYRAIRARLEGGNLEGR